MLSLDLAEFQGYGIWQDLTSFRTVSRNSASRISDSTVSFKTDFNIWISSSLYSGRAMMSSSLAAHCVSTDCILPCLCCFFHTYFFPPLLSRLLRPNIKLWGLDYLLFKAKWSKGKPFPIQVISFPLEWHRLSTWPLKHTIYTFSSQFSIKKISLLT